MQSGDSIIINDVMQRFTEAQHHIATMFAARGWRQACIWGCADSGEIVAALIRAAGVKLAAVYDSNRTGRFAGLPITHPDQGFPEGLPVIIASGRPRAALQSISDRLEQAGVSYLFCDNLTPPTLPISDFRNCHQGRRAFVIGNGPSLNQIDMGLLKDELTFGSNRCYLGFEKWGYPFTYWTIEDQLVAEDIRTEWNQLSGPIKFIPRDLQHLVTNHDNLVWVNFLRRPFDEQGPRFGDSINAFYWGGTVTYLLLQLAVLMGCSPIYLIGVDFSYVRPDHVRDLSQPGKWISGGDDPNHFSPDYFGKGRKWHDPNVARMGQAFAAAQTYAQARGLPILNATPGSKLDVFEKTAYAKLF